MAKFCVIFAMTGLIFAVTVNAEPPIQPGPYPAAGVTPETPFDLPTETEASIVQPDQAYGPPDSTYGPPPPEAASIDVDQPDNTYGPPTSDADTPTSDQPDGADLVSQNLIQPRARGFRRKGLDSAPLHLRAANFPRPSRVVEIVRSQPVLVYTLK